MAAYCFTCMNELTDGSFCPHCHQENTADEIVYRLKPGTILDNKYLVGNCLGEGGFGITYIGRDLSLDIRVAIKEYYPNGYVNRNHTVNQLVTATTESQKHIFYKGKDSFLEEARKVAKFLGEPGIVGIREYFEANGTAYIIMEYLDGENLASYIRHNGNFAPQQIFQLMLPITRSLKRIHDSGIIHRDISPDNIMYLRNGTLKLMDFGSARYFTNEQKEMSVLLKQGYAPEEQYRKNGKQGPWTDVYGLCATIYRCITGNIPEDALDRLHSDGLVPPSEMGIDIPPAMENILLYGLAVFKENRCQSMDELSTLIEQALYNPQLAAQQTANLVPSRRYQSPQGDPRTYLADEGVAQRVTNPPTGNPNVAQRVTNRPTGNPNVAQRVTNHPTGNPNVAQRVTNHPTGNPNVAQRVSNPPTGNSGVAQRVTPPAVNGNTQAARPVASPNYANKAAPVASSPQGASYASLQSSSGSYGVQTVPAPKKKKTGLIIGLVIGGIAVTALILTLIIMSAFGDTGIDGTYRLTEMVSNGEDMASTLRFVTIDLVIVDNVGTLDLGDDVYVWTFDPTTQTFTNEDDVVIPYRMEGTTLIIEDPSSSDKMVFEKQ